MNLRFPALLRALLLVFLPVIAGAQSARPVLPQAFSGWEQTGKVQRTTDPQQADATNAALLKEAGFVALERAAYQRQGRKLTVSAFRFNDATGAFAVYSALKGPAMADERFCDHSGSAENKVLIACTDLVVQAAYEKVTAMAPAEMRSLVSQLPRTTGSSAVPANAPLYLPKDARGDVRFALGPAGLTHTGTPLTADVIDFSKGPEVAVGHFDSLEGPTTLTLVKYPTFALAIDRQKAFDAFGKSLPKPPADQPQLQTFYTRRVGPIVAVVSGEITEQDARAIAEKVPYDLEVTRSEPVPTQRDNVGNLIVNILYLSFIIIGFTLVTGVAFGGFRIFARRFFPGRFVDRPEDVDFIKLDLGD